MQRKSMFILSLLTIIFTQICCGDVTEQIKKSQTNIFSLIDSGNYAEAETATQKMAADFAGNEIIARRVWEIANRYDRMEAYKYAKTFSAQVAADYPNDKYATYANLLLAKLNAYELIDKGDYSAANTAALEMVKNFPNHKQIAKRVWEIANLLDKNKAYEYSKLLCKQITANYPKDEYASYAGLQLAKLEIFELIDANNYESAEKATTQMMSDYEKNKQIARRLYEIAHQYEKKELQTYATELHSRIANEWPNDEYGVRAAFMYKMENKSILSGNKVDEAKLAIEKIKKDLEKNPALAEKMPHVMLNIAEICYDRAMEADVETENIEKWQQLSTEILEKDVIGKSTGSTLMTGYYVLGLNYYTKGRIAKTKDDIEGAKVNYRKAIDEWQSLINEFPNSKNTAKAYYSTGVLYAQELGEYQKGMDCFQKINNDFPNFEYTLEAKRLHNEYSEKQKITNNNIEGK